MITLVVLGKWLEARAKRGTTAAIRALLRLRPEIANVVRGGAEVAVAIEDVRIGERVVVRPGERYPVDGNVIEGESEADESLVTGESAPVVKRPGNPVTAGALNGTGRLLIAATAVGEDTTLARIIRMVENAQTGKAPVQRLVDRVSAVFVPAVVAIAIGAFIAWFANYGFEDALIAAVSVLVIACPCALGLATPAALVAGTGAAARAGILVKDIETLERAAGLDTVIFDKTGTLTEGRPAIATVTPIAGVDAAKLLRIRRRGPGGKRASAGARVSRCRAERDRAAGGIEFSSRSGTRRHRHGGEASGRGRQPRIDAIDGTSISRRWRRSLRASSARRSRRSSLPSMAAPSASSASPIRSGRVRPKRYEC